MKIGAASNFPYVAQRPQPSAADRATTSFSTMLSATKASSASPADFTSMTRQDMRDWGNTNIRSGALSLDDSRPFMAMTMHIPANTGEPAAGSAAARLDFMQMARDGIQGARSRDDDATLKMLEGAMAIMQRRQA